MELIKHVNKTPKKIKISMMMKIRETMKNSFFKKWPSIRQIYVSVKTKQQIPYFFAYFKILPSRQILVLKTSRGRPLKILFDRPGYVPIWRPGDVLKWRPGDVLIWRSRDVPGRWIRDVPQRTDLESAQTWMSKLFFFYQGRNLYLNFLNFSFKTPVYWEPSKTSKMEHFLQN